MDQLVSVQLAIAKVHTTPQSALDYEPELSGVIRVMGPTIPSLCLEYMWVNSIYSQ